MKPGADLPDLERFAEAVMETLGAFLDAVAARAPEREARRLGAARPRRPRA